MENDEMADDDPIGQHEVTPRKKGRRVKGPKRAMT